MKSEVVRIASHKLLGMHASMHDVAEENKHAFMITHRISIAFETRFVWSHMLVT